MTLIQAVLDAQTGGPKRDAQFPYMPEGWSKDVAIKTAQKEGLQLTDEHWAVVRALQEYFARHELKGINPRELHDALDEAFHADGGIKRLYQILPGGPVAQGCRLAGLQPPAGATDRGFGSMM
jgi:TusE/DsrC/DsvC family sulfur relay protein